MSEPIRGIFNAYDLNSCELGRGDIVFILGAVILKADLIMILKRKYGVCA
jgi:hypothetical protein